MTQHTPHQPKDGGLVAAALRRPRRAIRDAASSPDAGLVARGLARLTGAPEDRAYRALIGAITGKLDLAAVERLCHGLGLPAEGPFRGSLNIAAMADVARLIAGATYVINRLLRWLDGLEPNYQGLDGPERGSPTYGPWLLLCALAIHLHCLDHPTLSERLAAAVREHLRALWADLALCSLLAPIERVVWHAEGQPPERSAFRLRNQVVGPVVVPLGERVALKGPRRRSSLAAFKATAYHSALAWALDIPGRRRSAISRTPDMTHPWESPLWLLAHRSGRHFAQSLPADLVGLTDSERRALRQVVLDPDRADRLAVVRPWIRPTRPGQVRVIRRYDDGSVLWLHSPTVNAAKPGVVLVLYNAKTRELHVVSPGTWSGDRAQQAEAEIDDPHRRARARLRRPAPDGDFQTVYLQLPSLRYTEVHLWSQRVTVDGETPSGDTPPPPSDVDSGEMPPEWAKAHAGLSELMGHLDGSPRDPRFGLMAAVGVAVKATALGNRADAARALETARRHVQML